MNSHKYNKIGPGGIKCPCCKFKTNKGYRKEERRALKKEMEEEIGDYFPAAYEDYDNPGVLLEEKGVKQFKSYSPFEDSMEYHESFVG